MSFFSSEIVQNELEEINNIQVKIATEVFKYPIMTLDEKKSHIKLLNTLLEKQQLMYTRLSLSDDPDAIKMKKGIEESSRLLGFNDNDVHSVFRSMKMTIKNLENNLNT